MGKSEASETLPFAPFPALPCRSPTAPGSGKTQYMWTTSWKCKWLNATTQFPHLILSPAPGPSTRLVPSILHQRRGCQDTSWSCLAEFLSLSSNSFGIWLSDEGTLWRKCKITLTGLTWVAGDTTLQQKGHFRRGLPLVQMQPPHARLRHATKTVFDENSGVFDNCGYSMLNNYTRRPRLLVSFHCFDWN